MASGQLTRVIDHLRRLVRPADVEDLSDAALLERFLARREECAFETLVRRHGPMVLSVCRRFLRDPHDAEDAFQATFLVLVKKAGSISRRELLANWLYGVAQRTAMKARSLNARRRAKERQVDEMPPAADRTEEVREDLHPLLDQELGRLPAKYRIPMVLCELEGKSRKEAAEELGCPEGTLSSRLARGREMLGKRLSRRGVALSAGALSAVLAEQAAPAAVSVPLVHSTVQAALVTAAGNTLAAGVVSAHVAALTEGVLQAMYVTKLKIAAVIALTVGLIGTGAGVATHYALAERTGEISLPAPPAVALLDDDAVLFDGSEFFFEDKADKTADDADKPNKADKVKKDAGLSGRVAAVSADGKTLTLELPPKTKGEAGEKVEIKLTAETKFTYLEVPEEKPTVGYAAVVHLAEGSKDTAAAVRFGDKKKVVGDQPKPDLAGKIAAVANDGKTITIELPPKNKGEAGEKVEIKLTDKTKLMGDEKPAVGQVAFVWLVAGSKDTASGITVTKKGDKGAKGDAKAPDLAGQIAAVANDGKTITVEVPSKNKGEAPAKIEIKITENTRVNYFNVETEKPTVGYIAQVWLVDGSKDTAAGLRMGQKGQK